MWFLHHFIRVIWANLFGVFAHWYYAMKMRTDTDAYGQYWEHQDKWNHISSLEELQAFVRTDYEYKWDGYKGFFDHNNFSLEWFYKFGDCDDMGYYAYKKIKSLYGDKLEYCRMRGYADLTAKPAFYHYDCVFKFKDSGDYQLFNYGKIKTGKSLKELDNIMEKLYDKSYEFKKMVSWDCYWR